MGRARSVKKETHTGKEKNDGNDENTFEHQTFCKKKKGTIDHITMEWCGFLSWQDDHRSRCHFHMFLFLEKRIEQERQE
jgi:hypothetical protein